MLEITGGRILRPDGTLASTSLCVQEAVIAAVGDDGTATMVDGAPRRWHADGLLVLPGMVDLHGDAFERQLMPRPGVRFDHALALLDTDRQLVANGITTACLSLTWSWEPGLPVRILPGAVSPRGGSPGRGVGEHRPTLVALVQEHGVLATLAAPASRCFRPRT